MPQARFCKPDTSGKCRQCKRWPRHCTDECILSVQDHPNPFVRAAERKASQPPKKIVTQRSDEERLAIITDHCSTCDHFKDAATFDKLKCRLAGSCGCLWNKLGSRLFGCPDRQNPRFERDEAILQEFNRQA